ncbi:sulfite exporter TauE/SafE family protein [Ottowia thiooxydans]|uniref:sulfite exporter TauE/SafE family protein n=1 Tax=Ottowia thiooxydans TaxID=219182 RepID=UPI0003FF992C|nr:sulfite exporter TauE/SafE family protein [Ottowia thiooxydans]
MDIGFPHAALMTTLGVLCGVVAVTAGGGVTIGVPLLMLLGVPATVSVIAVKVALWASFLTGSIAHAKKQPALAVAMPWWIWPMCLLGAVAGAQVLAALNPERMNGLVLTLLIVSIAGTFHATRHKAGISAAPTRAQRATGFLAMLALAIYSGFFGAGFGVFLIWALVALHGHSPSSAAALGTRLSLVISTASVAVFMWNGVVPWSVTIPLGIGCAAGGLLGARATQVLGDRFIKTITWVVSILVALKLLVSSLNDS